jgi:hypothetical protein
MSRGKSRQFGTAQLTLRPDDERVRRRIREVALERGLSLNKAALHLLKKGAGLDLPKTADWTIGGSLDRHFGTWSKEQVRELEKAVRAFEQIDEEMWR